MRARKHSNEDIICNCFKFLYICIGFKMNNLAYISLNYKTFLNPAVEITSKPRVFCLVFSPSLTPQRQRTITYNKEPLKLCEDIRRDEILLTESRQWLFNQIPSILALDFLLNLIKLLVEPTLGKRGIYCA